MYVPLVKCSRASDLGLSRARGAYPRPRGADQHARRPTPIAAPAGRRRCSLIERLIDIAARQFGYDRIDLRRRNLIPPSAQPYANPLGMTYDSGDYAKVMDRALALADWKGFGKRKRESKRNGKLRGIGLANYIEITSGAPRE